jgi:hypothetical protein
MQDRNKDECMWLLEQHAAWLDSPVDGCIGSETSTRIECWKHNLNDVLAHRIRMLVACVCGLRTRLMRSIVRYEPC